MYVCVEECQIEGICENDSKMEFCHNNKKMKCKENGIRNEIEQKFCLASSFVSFNFDCTKIWRKMLFERTSKDE